MHGAAAKSSGPSLATLVMLAVVVGEVCFAAPRPSVAVLAIVSSPQPVGVFAARSWDDLWWQYSLTLALPPEQDLGQVIVQILPSTNSPGRLFPGGRDG